MNVDNTTLYDLSIFAHEEELSVFHTLDFTRTIGGKAWLRHYVHSPLENIKQINDRQVLLQRILQAYAQWPLTINNGTIMVLEKYFEASVEAIPHAPHAISALYYKIINAADYSLIEYTVTHFTAFVKGMQVIKDILSSAENPGELSIILERINALLKRPAVERLLQTDKAPSKSEVLAAGHFLKYDFKTQCLDLIELYHRLDAFYSLAAACKQYNFIFPQLTESSTPFLTFDNLVHPLLQTPVAYAVALTQEQNFLFLTGANMAGKSTFIKAVGIAAYLAHIGMAVPAKKMELTYLDGLLSNINVADNVVKGESYFFNEVQRIHKTIEKISDGKKWLILIDELFKGTNVQDAMKCSTVVIEGLRKMKNVIFILSTHLYEIGEDLKKHSNIQFRYFETQVNNDQLVFNYQLKEGISNDRLGFLILKKEGVVDMLEKL